MAATVTDQELAMTVLFGILSRYEHHIVAMNAVKEKKTHFSVNEERNHTERAEN